MSAELSELSDQMALSRLVDLYARAVDRGDLILLRSLYADDAVHDHGPMFRGGPDAFISFIDANMQDMTTQHFMGNRLFIVSGDEAEGETYSINSHVIGKGSENPRDYIAGGRYLDRFRRDAGGWRFLFRSRVVDWSHEGPHQPGQTAKGLPQPGKGHHDPSHALLPLIAAIRA